MRREVPRYGVRLERVTSILPRRLLLAQDSRLDVFRRFCIGRLARALGIDDMRKRFGSAISEPMRDRSYTYRVLSAVIIVSTIGCSGVSGTLWGPHMQLASSRPSVLRFARHVRPNEGSGALHWLSSQGLGEA